MIANVVSFHNSFNKVNISIIQEKGYEVTLIANKYSDSASQTKVEEFERYCIVNRISFHHIDIPRTPFRLIRLLFSILKVNRIVKELDIRLIHSHTPVGGLIGRLVAKFNNVQNIYTAHGFHFYKGAPLFNWLVYYPIELMLSFFSDAIITINQEDYDIAVKSFKKEVFYVPGIGIDISRFNNTKLDKQNDVIQIGSVGELNINKNQKFVIQCLMDLEYKVDYKIAGTGSNLESIKKMIDNSNKPESFFLLGYVDKIDEFLNTLDIFVFPSKREGLSVALMEAMAAGLPVIASNIRGNRDLIDHGKGGYLFDLSNQNEFNKYLEILIKDNELRLSMGNYNKTKIKHYDISNIREQMSEIYSKYLIQDDN